MTRYALVKNGFGPNNSSDTYALVGPGCDLLEDITMLSNRDVADALVGPDGRGRTSITVTSGSYAYSLKEVGSQLPRNQVAKALFHSMWEAGADGEELLLGFLGVLRDVAFEEGGHAEVERFAEMFLRDSC